MGRGWNRWKDGWIDGIDGYSGVLCCVCVCVVGGVALPEGTCGRERERRPGGGGRGEPEGAVVGRANNTRKKYNPSIIHPLKLKSEGKGGKGEEHCRSGGRIELEEQCGSSNG